MMSIPNNPCPVHGLVPWAGGIWPIVWRGPHPVLGWLYTIHEKQKDLPLCIHWNVSQANIVQRMEEVAEYTPGQYVQLGPLTRNRVIARKWSFERGQFFYMVEGAKKGQQWSIAEDELVKRVKAVEEEHG